VVIVLMGGAGAGKTTLGRALAAALGWQFFDADAFRLPHSIEKMRSGIVLDERDRAPWIARIHAMIRRAVGRREHLVIACSALKQRHRYALRDDLRPVRFVYLRGSESLLRSRLATGPDPSSGTLLATELAEIEEPSENEAVVVDAALPLDRLLIIIRAELGV
jgi:gluconokinase